MKKLLLLLSCVTILSSCTDTYDECIYKKIKACDDNKPCVGAARRLCDSEFPHKLAKWEQVDWDDVSDSEGKIKITDIKFGTKICFANTQLSIKEECVSWNYSAGLSLNRYSQFEVAEQMSDFHKFLNPDKTQFLDGTTYRHYRADRYRKGSKP